MMFVRELELILVLQMTALVWCTTKQDKKSANLVYENHPKNFDHDENYKIMVTRGREMIDSTLTRDGHARVITVTVSAFAQVFHLDLKLNTYLFAKGYVEKTINQNGVIYHDVNHTERHCYYLGNVRGQPLSRAAVSTCQGIVGYFTIGNVSYHIEPHTNRLYGDHRVYRSRNDVTAIYRNYKFIGGFDQMSIASLLKHEKHQRRLRRSPAWPQDLDKKNKVLEIYVASDRSQYVSKGSDSVAVFQRAKDIINIASLSFQPLGIYLVLVGSVIWSDPEPITIDTANIKATLDEWAKYRMTSINPNTFNDHGVLITNNTFVNQSLGLAYISGMCSNRLSASIVSDAFMQPVVAASVVDYGIGINFGVVADSGNCSCDDPSGYCIMGPTITIGSPSMKWSQCSKDQFEAIFGIGLDICLQNMPEYILNINASSSTCGNGIVESGEECDCGNSTDSECNKRCCDSTTCQLSVGATCAYGRCCNISLCQVLPCNTTCRQKTSDCDLVEVCNGVDGLCNRDTYKPDGTECLVNGVSAYCYSGLCQSRQSQCELIWGSGTLVSSDTCYNSYNILGTYYGNCGINWLPNVTYIPCNASDVFCGRLQCQDNSKTLHYYVNYFGISSASVGNDTCHAVIFDFGLATQDPGLVPSGTKCGYDKMCVGQRCVDVNKTSYCASVCGPDEVCNNLRQCQKIAGSCPKEHTTSFITTGKPTTPFITTPKSATSIITTPKPTTPFVTTHKPTTSIVTTPKPTTPFVTTPKPTTPFVTTPKPTTPTVTTPKPTTPFVTTPTFVTTPKSTKPEATTLEATSSKIAATYGVTFVSTALKTTNSNRNACDSSPCPHSATCVDLVGDYKCSCAEGYRGHLCEEEIAECDSDPCQHDSTCKDGVNFYQCQCLDGYTGRNCETDVNECESNPCPINSTCVDNINRYQCICPNPDQFIGIHCNITVPLPEKSDSPEFVETSPKYGPISGGTKITINGRNLDKYGGISFIYIGTMKLPIKNWTRSWSEFFVVTTPGESSMVGNDQHLIFEITGGKNISSNFIFTYQPDPEIEDVKPTEHLASGGTTLTILGNNLNSSAAPYLRAILDTITPGRLNKNITISNGPKCNASSSNEIYCLMPRVSVSGNTVVNQTVKGHREENPPNVTTTYIFLTLKSDGAEDAPNKSIDYLPYQGNLTSVSGPVYYNPEDDEFIHIKGSELNIGISVDDYEIHIGIGECTNKTLTANELRCRPPTEEPDPGSGQALYCSESGGLPVIVFPGRKVDEGDRKQFKWACLFYPGSGFSWWIVGVICGGCALVLLVTVVCVVLCRRRLKRQREASGQRVLSTTRPSGNSVDPAQPDWAKIQVDAQGKLKSKPRNVRNDTYASRLSDDLELNNDVKMREFRPNDYNGTLASNWTRSNINIEELDMMAAERNATDLRNPVSVRYSYGLLSGDDSGDAAPQVKSDYINNESASDISAPLDWRDQRRQLRPETPRQFGGNWKATDDNSVIVGPAVRANTHDFLGQNGGFNSPPYGSSQLTTNSDSTVHRFGHGGQ